MFNSARIKLTSWYLLIIMIISISFSVAIYEVLTSELNRVEQAQRTRQRTVPIPGLEDLPPEFRQRIYRTPMIDPALITETKERLKIVLVIINLSILGFAGIAGYFLAGRTLRPIKEMIDEQSRFITDSSHELRTPLTSLKSEIEVNLRDKNLSLINAKKLLESNLEEVNNLQYLSDNLIKLTQTEKINDHNSFEKVSLKNISEDAIKKVLPMAKGKNIKITNSVKNDQIMGDKQSLVELFVILLDNAIKYSDSKTTISLNSKNTDTSLRVEVKDHGMGIDKKDLPHLFDRFYRADKSRTKEGVTGYGLGLSIAKQIIEKHSGQIKVESVPGKGTTFTIIFPAK